VPAGYERRQDHGGDKRRAVCLQIPGSTTPFQPWVMGITLRAANSGPDGKSLTASIGMKAHEIA
jgi:hypothetical protein